MPQPEMPSPPTGSCGGAAERGDPLARGLDLGGIVAAQEVVVLLARRVGADDGEAVAVGRAAVAGAGGQDEHVAGLDLEGLALRAAELDRGPPGDDGERLVRGRVEVVEVEHAGHPRAAPAVVGEQRAGGVRARRRRPPRRGRAAPGSAGGWGCGRRAAPARSRAPCRADYTGAGGPSTVVRAQRVVAGAALPSRSSSASTAAASSRTGASACRIASACVGAHAPRGTAAPRSPPRRRRRRRARASAGRARRRSGRAGSRRRRAARGGRSPAARAG